MSDTQRRGWDAQECEFAFDRTSRDDKSCRDPWCCGKAPKKLNSKRRRRQGKREALRQTDT